MSGVPAECPKCGLLWTSQAVAVREAGAVVMSNNTVSCPRCGARSRLAEGRFSFDAAGTPTIVSAPPATHEMFARIYRVLRDKSVSKVDIAALADIANRATAGDLTVEAAAAAATAVNDRFAGIFRGQESGWLAVILTIVLFFISERGGDLDHAEAMAAIRQNQAIAEQQLEIEIRQLEQLKRMADQKAGRSIDPPITEPPPGPRTKRQQRRDRRFQSPQRKRPRRFPGEASR